MTTPSSKTTAQLLELCGRSAIVTGAAYGIGLGIARRLGQAGARVLLADLKGEAAEAAAEQLRQDGVTARAIQVDVACPADVERMVQAAVDAHEGVDLLVNNAGIYPLRPALEMTEAEWDRVLDVNLKGSFLCAQAAARRMVAQGRGGVILNIASIDALHPSMVGLAHYDASKGGMLMLTRNLALELGSHGIRVLALAPGGITTEGSKAILPGGVDPEMVMQAFTARIPLGRMGEPDDIGRVALFLVSDAAAYMTGTMVVVDGGYLLS